MSEDSRSGMSPSPESNFGICEFTVFHCRVLDDVRGGSKKIPQILRVAEVAAPHDSDDRSTIRVIEMVPEIRPYAGGIEGEIGRAAGVQQVRSAADQSPAGCARRQRNDPQGAGIRPSVRDHEIGG